MPTAPKVKFFIKDFFSKCDQIPQEIADLVIFTEKILNVKLHFLCSDQPELIIVDRNVEIISRTQMHCTTIICNKYIGSTSLQQNCVFYSSLWSTKVNRSVYIVSRTHEFSIMCKKDQYKKRVSKLNYLNKIMVITLL